MDMFGPHPLRYLCAACGLVTTHHPFAKPGCPDIGLVCGRCGLVLMPGSLTHLLPGIDHEGMPMKAV